MIKYKIYHSIYLIITIILLQGCDIDSSTTTTNSNYMKGYLIDSRVAGIKYECSHDNINGITNNDGLFYFTQNCNILSFKLGNTILASINIKDIPFDNKLYISDLVNVDRNNSNNIKVVNIIRLLQTLDSDNNSHNGIDINDTIRNNITNFYIHEVKNITVPQELNNILVDANYTGILMSKTKALVHYEQTLRENNISVDTVPPFRPELDLRQFTLDSGKILYKQENNITTIAVSNDKIDIKFYAEYGSRVSLNNQLLNTITQKQPLQHSYIDNFELNTSHAFSNFRDYNITLTDNTNKTSLALKLRILKDLNRPNFNIATYDFNVTIPNKSIVDINITDLDINTLNEDANGLVIYEVVSSNKNLFDINKSGFLKFKENSIAKDYNVTIRITDFARHYKEQNLTIHSIN